MFSQHYFATVFLPFLIFDGIKLINDRSVDNMKMSQALMVNFERINAELTDTQIDEIITWIAGFSFKNFHNFQIQALLFWHLPEFLAQ